MSHRFNNSLNRVVAVPLAALLMLNLTTPAWACGPFFIEPIFVFAESPDLPFADFTGGKIGIIKPTFGRKTLTIAFRYLNGGSFTTDEQKALTTALRGKATEKPETDPVKTWVETRKGFLAENEKLPAIYVEQRFGGYDFFPNCTPNAFEVATETLKARVASYGADDKNVRLWLAAQDTVFQNCSTAGKFPRQLGKESIEWLRKDRDYQIAAANFYSLNFDQARILFTAISRDPESPWQETADYLVARNWVRQASLTPNEAQRNEIYKQAELYLQALQLRTTNFARATQRLLALVKYRIHPEQRVGELARILAYQNGNDNLAQDLIDYVWLVDKFETEKLEEIEKRKSPQNDAEAEAARFNRERWQAINTGQTLTITIYPKMKEGTPDYSEWVMLGFDKDATEADVIQGFEIKAGRKLTEAELKQIKEGYASAREYSEYLSSPNRKLDDRASHERHKGCDYGCERLSINAIPENLRADDLTDWMLTFQTEDPAAYRHAHAKWRETKSDAWLAVVLAKAQKTSPRLAQALRRGEQIERDSPAFPTVAYHLIRLRIAMGQPLQARAILDDILSWQGEALPISSQNQFLEQRMRLSKTLDEFLHFSGRWPATFNYDGRLGSILNLMEEAKGAWIPEYSQQTKEEYAREIEKAYEPRLPWDFQSNFDDATIDILNWYFPVSLIAEASRSPALPDHLRRRLLLMLWTRAVVLKQPAIAEKIAPEVLKLAPEMAGALQDYIDAPTPQERNHAALFVLLKFPNLSPLLRTSLPDFDTVEDQQYYLQDAWWCAPSDTAYNLKGDEVTKVVFKPLFLSGAQIEAARRERAALVAIDDAKSYLGKQTIAWARSAPLDARVPEALYITVQANSKYKYGCSGWEHDDKTKKQAETLLRTRYPQSPWTAKLSTDER